MPARLFTLLLLAACTPESPKDTAEPVDTDTGTGDTGDSASDTSDTGADTADSGADTADTSDTEDTSDTSDTVDTGPCSAPSFTGRVPLAWYSLEDAGSASVIDSTGGYDATSSGAVTAVAGKAGMAAQLDGTSAHLDADAPLTTGTFSWAGWVRLDSLPSGDFGMIANHGNGSTSYSGWLFVVNSTGIPSLFTEGGSSGEEIATSATSPLVVGAWTHLAFTFNAGEVFLYVNGNPAAGRDLNYAAVVDGGNPYVLGRDANNGSRYLPGTLDEVGYWNTVLTPADITALFDDGECGLSSI